MAMHGKKTKMILQMPICPENTEPLLPFSGRITGFRAASIGTKYSRDTPWSSITAFELFTENGDSGEKKF